MCSTVSLVILCKCVLLVWLQVSSSFACDCTTATKEQPIPGNANELVLAKLDRLESKLETLFNLAGHNLTTLQEQSRRILAQQAACTSHEKELSQPSAKQEISTDGQLLAKSPCSLGDEDQGQLKWCKEPPANNSEVYSVKVGEKEATRNAIFNSCQDAPANKSGIYSIVVNAGEQEAVLDAFCEQNSFGGGWLVIQYRFDGSLDFRESWTEYRKGFGNNKQEFWIGLEWLHRLTSSRPVELMVEIKDFQGKYGYAHYSAFEVGSESEQYPLRKLGAYDGTAGDSLTYSTGMKFSTHDRDNDEDTSLNCAAVHEGAWWHKACRFAHLNGRYWNMDSHRSMVWFYFHESNQGMAYSRMMVREINTV